MRFPISKNIVAEIDTFGGIRLDKNVSGGFKSLLNLSSSAYPAASSVIKGTKVRSFDDLLGIMLDDKLAYCSGERLYYDDQRVSGLTLSSESYKEIVPMGQSLVIYPDKVYYNTESNTHGEISSSYETVGGTEVILTPCSKDGISVSGGSEYVRINAPEIGEAFSLGDGVLISGCPVVGIDGEKIIYAMNRDYIVINAALPAQFRFLQSFKVERSAFDLDIVTRHNDRLWGVRYGFRGEEFVNEIRACKAGDPTNWNYVSGGDEDSYLAKLGSRGVFTGMISHKGYLYIFKENEIYKIYGNDAKSFNPVSVGSKGVRPGCAQSLVSIGDYVYYLANDGVYRFDGQDSVNISYPLGRISGSFACAGSRDRYYYLYVKDGYSRHLYVYDTENGVWCKEECPEISKFIKRGEELLYISKNDLVSVKDGEGFFEFSATTCPLMYDTFGLKRAKEVRLSVEGRNAWISVLIDLDGKGSFSPLGTVSINGAEYLTFPVISPEARYFALRLEGGGDIKISHLSLIATLAEGGVSDVG